MQEWAVQLQGHEFALQVLFDQFSSLLINVTKEDDNYCLRSSRFDDLTDAQEVRESALACIELMNGTAKLDSNDFKNVAIGKIYRITEGGRTRQEYVFGVANIQLEPLRLKAYGEVGTGGNSHFNTGFSRQSSVLETWTELAEKNPEVARALKFLIDPSGYNLFKIFEIIKKDVGGEEQINKKFSITKAEISSFRGSVNRSDVWGDKARHAVDSGDPPKNTMSYEEAIAFIRDMLRKWMASKN
jgi:hypothetical protein